MQEFEIEFDFKPIEFEIEMEQAIQEIYPELENLEVTPTNEEQKFRSEKYGYKEITVKKVTNDIDADIKPENIKLGVNILGVEGGYFGIDTSDATAITEDILQGKTAYVNNKKITGTIQKYDGAYTGDVGTENECEVFYRSMIDDSYGGNVTKLPKDITTIGNYAFYYREKFFIDELPESITSIGNSAFGNCYKLTISKLPKGLISLGRTAFYNTPVTINEIPEGVDKIPSNCFQKCTKITSMKILGNSFWFESSAFNEVTNLEKVIMPNITNVPLGESNMFRNTKIASGTGYIYVPDNLVDSFKTASYWSTYADQIKPISELEV